MAGIGLDGILTLWSRQPDTLCKPFICIFMSDPHKREYQTQETKTWPDIFKIKFKKKDEFVFVYCFVIFSPSWVFVCVLKPRLYIGYDICHLLKFPNMLIVFRYLVVHCMALSDIFINFFCNHAFLKTDVCSINNIYIIYIYQVHIHM